MFESLRRERAERAPISLTPTLGFFALAFEVYAFVAARLALGSERFVAPLSLIFFTLDHTEFLIFIVAVVCGVDYFMKRTPTRAIIWTISLVPLGLLILLIISLALR